MHMVKKQTERVAESVPEHFMHCFKVQSISIIHEAEAVLFIDYSLINPELFGQNIWIIGIVCQKKQILRPNKYYLDIICWPPLSKVAE